MVDLALEAAARLPARPQILDRFALKAKDFAVATIHRASNTEDTHVFARLVAGLRRISTSVVFPVHPRTRALVEGLRVGVNDNIITCEPLSYTDMLALQKHARVVVTDSGGIQKEAVTLGTPCVTLRSTTEWTETLEGGWNVLAGNDPRKIADAANRPVPAESIHPFGEGNSARRIVDALFAHIAVAERTASCAS